MAAIKGRNVWRCRECDRQFTAKVGTIFEDSPIGFDRWLPALWMLTSCRNGVSSYEISRALKVTQKTAWFMLHRLRAALKLESFDRLMGEVETDETYIGGKPRRQNVGRQLMHRKGGGRAGKTTVMGMIERSAPGRSGRVRAFVVADAKIPTLLPKISANIEQGSTIYTDALRAYEQINPSEYRHLVINHAVRYVEGKVHTNNIENFWSVLKRTLGGTYIATRAFHLDAYIDEQVFRFNARRDTDGPRFVQGLKGADGRRLTWKQLTTAHPKWRETPKAYAVRRRPRVESDGLNAY